MKNLKKYECPLVEIVEVEVEKGFAASTGANAGEMLPGNVDGWEF